LSDLPKLTVIKIARTWSPIPLSSEFSKPSYRIISAAYTLPVDVLLLIGLFTKSLSRRDKMMLMLPAIYFTILCVFSVGSLRYRVPVAPLLAVIAGAGVADLKQRLLPCPSL
jgi:hypothetical protein